MENTCFDTTDQVTILLVEDDPDDATLIGDILHSRGRAHFSLHIADTLAEGLRRLRHDPVDLVLLDLILPDSQGLETFFRAQKTAPAIPFIILSGISEETISRQAVRAGAQDFLLKGEIASSLLVRMIYHALERSRLARELEQERLNRLRKNELEVSDRLPVHRAGQIEENFSGASLLCRSATQTFLEMVDCFSDLMDLAVEKQVYKTDSGQTDPCLSDRLMELAGQLGALKSGPQDVVDIYTRSLKDKLNAVSPGHARTYLEEGRLMVLALMGYLAAYYRSFAVNG